MVPSCQASGLHRKCWRLMRSWGFRPRPSWLLVLAPIVLLAPVWLTGRSLYWGTPSLQFHPWRVTAWRMLQDGVLPLWNPQVGLGAPLLANYQSGLLYPPNFLYYFFALIGGEGGMAWGMSVLVVLHWILAALGMQRLTAALKLERPAQLIAALSFSLSGYLVARAGFLSINAAAAWLPWLLWASYRLICSGPRASRSAVVAQSGRLAFFLGLLLMAGHAQTAWYSLFFLGLWSLFWLFHAKSHPAHSQVSAAGSDGISGPGIASRWRFALIGLAAAGLWGMGLAAAQLLPTAELLAQSQRSAGADYDFVMTYSFWPWRLIGLVAPNFFGSPVSGNYWGFGNFWEDAVYIGLLPLLLAVRASLAPNRTRQPGLAKFLTATAIIVFVLALGQNTPVFPFLYRYIPSFDLFQAPTRISFIAVFCLSLLAGFGADRWRRPRQPKTFRWLRRGWVVALAMLIAAAGLLLLDLGAQASFIPATALAGFLALIAATLALRAPHAEQVSVHWTWMITTFVAVDLLIAGWGLNPGIDTQFYTERLDYAAELRARLSAAGQRIYASETLVYSTTFDEVFRFDSFESKTGLDRSLMLPNFQLIDDLYSANNFDPLLSERYSRYIEFVESGSAAERIARLEFIGVGLVDGEQALPGALQRLRWTACALPENTMDSAWRMAWEAPDPEFAGMVVLENYESNAQWICGSERGIAATAKIELESSSPLETVVHVDAESSGWLILADNWYPGWRATVNGQRESVHPADGLFQAVRTPAGASEIVLSYQPLSFQAGGWMSGISWVALMLAWIVHRRRTHADD